LYISKIFFVSAEMHVNAGEFLVTANPQAVSSYRHVRNVVDYDYHEMTGSFFQSQTETGSPLTLELDTNKIRKLRWVVTNKKNAKVNTIGQFKDVCC
jgi:hypothetical protein